MAKGSRKKSKTKKKPQLLALPRRTAAMAAVGVLAAFMAGAVTVAVFAWAPDQPAPVATVAAPLPEKKPAPPVLAARLDPPQAAPSSRETVAPREPVAPPPAVAGPPPWERNARPEPTAGANGNAGGNGWRVAIVIDDAGLDVARTARTIALPAPLTIAFLTYGEGLAPQVRAAHAAGHELMVHVAMEATRRTVDPGPDVLLRDIEPDEVLARLRRVLAKFDGYVGINNHMGSLFTSDIASMRIVLGELKRRGLLFLDSRTAADSVGGKVARALDLPFAERDVFLDNDPSEHEVDRQLAELERVARAKGAAIAIGHPRDGTLDALAKWIPDARARGFVFVPVSTVVKDNRAKAALTARR